MEVVIINEELFKKNSPIQDDTIINKFIPFLSFAQKIYIEKILGRALTEEIQNQINAAAATPTPSPNPISEKNQALILLIAPALSFYAVYMGLPFHWAAILNKGVTLQSSENSDPVNLTDISQMKRWLKDIAEGFAAILTDYLCECRDNYPLWKPGTGCGCSEDNINGTRAKDYDAGIYIPRY